MGAAERAGPGDGMKVTPKIRREIEAGCRRGERRIDLAAQYGISACYVTSIAGRIGLLRKRQPSVPPTRLVVKRLRKVVAMQTLVFGKTMAASAFPILIACMILAAGMLAANAAPRHQRNAFAYGLGAGLAHMVGLDARPHAWCGWWMRHNVGSDPGRDFNLARDWARWGHAASGPAPGVIGVMPHHVFKVVQVLGAGRVLAISGNDSHAVRTRVRSTVGVIAWRVN